MKHLLPLLLLFSGAARAQEDTVHLKDFTGILYTSKDTVFYKLDSAKKYDKAIMIKTIISGALMGRDTIVWHEMNLLPAKIMFETNSGAFRPIIGWVLLHDFDNSYYSFDKKHLLDNKKVWGYKLL